MALGSAEQGPTLFALGAELGNPVARLTSSSEPASEALFRPVSPSRVARNGSKMIEIGSLSGREVLREAELHLAALAPSTAAALVLARVDRGAQVGDREVLPVGRAAVRASKPRGSSA